MAAAEEAGEFPGIPAARFISDVPGALGGRDPGALLQELQAQYQNYKMLEQRLMQARQRMQTKVRAPERLEPPPRAPPNVWQGTEGGRLPAQLGRGGGEGGGRLPCTCASP